MNSVYNLICNPLCNHAIFETPINQPHEKAAPHTN
jgi:hypothetical protein